MVEMIARFSLFFLLLITSAYSTERPQTGNYIFIKNFEITGCVQYVGGRGIGGGQCVKFETKKFIKGDKIKVDDFFWNDQVKNFEAKIVIFDQNRGIPLEFIQITL